MPSPPKIVASTESLAPAFDDGDSLHWTPEGHAVAAKALRGVFEGASVKEWLETPAEKLARQGAEAFSAATAAARRTPEHRASQTRKRLERAARRRRRGY